MNLFGFRNTVEAELGVASFLVNHFQRGPFLDTLWLYTPFHLYPKRCRRGGLISCPFYTSCSRKRNIQYEYSPYRMSSCHSAHWVRGPYRQPDAMSPSSTYKSSQRRSLLEVVGNQILLPPSPESNSSPLVLPSLFSRSADLY